MRRLRTAMDVGEQMATIHALARMRMTWFARASGAVGVVLAGLGLVTRQPPYVMAAVLAGLVAYAAHQATPHIRAASRAISHGTPIEGLVDIEIDTSSDTTRYYSTVSAAATDPWRFEFMPMGWAPVAGQLRATLYSLEDLDWPALVEVPDGVMFPRYTPTRVES